jgi:DNA-binding transcriptional regulator YiaG
LSTGVLANNFLSARFIVMSNDRRVTAADIRAARARVDESQSQFADRFGVDRSTIGVWERRGLPKKGAAPRLIEQEILNIVQPREKPDGAGVE